MRNESVLSSDSDQSVQSITEMREANSKLKLELETQKNQSRTLKRDKSYELKQLKDQEQNKLNIALKDLRAKLNKEKTRELELQKEALNKKSETDIVKVAKQKDLEIDRIQGDLHRCQEELTEMIKRGLSGSARGTFVAERGKLTREVTELRSAKQQLEDTLAVIRESDRRRREELHRSGCREKSLREQLQEVKTETLEDMNKLVSIFTLLKLKYHIQYEC